MLEDQRIFGSLELVMEVEGPMEVGFGPRDGDNEGFSGESNRRRRGIFQQ